MTTRQPRRSLLAQTANGLARAWKSVRVSSSRHSYGPDGVSLDHFERDWLQRKAVIRRQLLDGTYAFSGYRGHAIRKTPDARTEDLKAWRPISIASISDRVVQRAILDTIWTSIRDRLCTEASYGGVRPYLVHRKRGAPPVAEESSKKCVRSAAARIRKLKALGFEWIFETDIENFFPTVDRARVLATLFSQLRDNSLNGLIAAALGTSITNAAQLGGLADLWKPETGVPQGGTLSPTVANYYLYEFDKAVLDAGFHMVRYVDDLVVLTRTEEEAERAYEICEAELARLGLTIHKLGAKSASGRTKTAIHGPGEPFDFLGLAFSRRSVRPAQKKFTALFGRLEELTDTRREHGTLPRVIDAVNWCLKGWLEAFKFCNLTPGDFAIIDRTVASRMRSWLKRRGMIRREKELSNEAYRWLGITKAAKAVRIRPIAVRLEKSSH